MKILPSFAWIENPSLTLQMALLADAVSSPVWESCRIYNIRRLGAPNMFFRRSVAAFAADRRERTGNQAAVVPGEFGRAGMTKEAGFRDRTVKVHDRRGRVSRRHIPSICP